MPTDEQLYTALHLLGIEPEGIFSAENLRERLHQATAVVVEEWKWKKQSAAIADMQTMNAYALIATFASEWWRQQSAEEWMRVGSETRLEPGNLIRYGGGWHRPREVAVLVAKYEVAPGVLTYLWVPLLDPERGSAICASGPLPSGAEYIEGVTPLLRRGKYPRMTHRFEYSYEEGRVPTPGGEQ